MADEISKKDLDNREKRKEKIFSWLNTHWNTDKKCPICQNSQWNVNLETGVMPVGKYPNIIFNENFPFVVINCSVCGYTFLMNEIIMGMQYQTVTDPKKEEK